HARSRTGPGTTTKTIDCGPPPGRYGQPRAFEEDPMSQWNKYGPTAARAQVRPGREIRPKSLTVDLHSHLCVPRARECGKPHLSPVASPLVRFANAETKALNQKQEADIVARA